MPRCRLFYHYTWSTKHRAPTITAALRPALYAAIVKKVSDLGGYVHAINGMEEHVHVVVQLPPTLAPATFIGQAKGYSSHSANRLGRDRPERRFQWQEEYSVETVSERALPAVIRYVENQQRHHAANGGEGSPEDW